MPAPLTDDFLVDVAADYRAYVSRGSRRPAVDIARARRVSVKTVHGWIARARVRGHMEPAEPGRITDGTHPCPTCGGSGRV